MRLQHLGDAPRDNFHPPLLRASVEISDSQNIRRGALRYLWRQDAFLTRQEAEYALAQLWRLCAGTAEWNAEPLLEIPSIDSSSVQAMHETPPGQLVWIRLEDLLPSGRPLKIDTDRLPALCRVDRTTPCEFRGSGPFPLDLVTATFLMLTRWEEIHRPGPPDGHGRAQPEHSLAYRQSFLDRPIIDEWAFVLRSWIEKLSPGWRARPPRFQVILSHDLDRPRRYPSPWQILRAAGAECALRSHNPIAAISTIANGITGLFFPERDPYVQGVEEQLDACDKLGIRGSFNVMTARRSHYDDGYCLDQPFYREMLNKILRKGHRIGWHPGYRAADHPSMFTKEKETMDRWMGGTPYGGRHHYLRWNAGKSWEQWEDHQLIYDSSVGYSPCVGYRCGTSRPFPCFSIPRQKELFLIEEPLIAMDCALERSAANQNRSATVIVEELLRRAKAVDGSPSVVYHNTYDYYKRTTEDVKGAMLRAISNVL